MKSSNKEKVKITFHMNRNQCTCYKSYSGPTPGPPSLIDYLWDKFEKRSGDYLPQTYLRVFGDHYSSDARRCLYGKGKTVFGYEIENAGRNGSVSVKFGKARINGKTRNIVLVLSEYLYRSYPYETRDGINYIRARCYESKYLPNNFEYGNGMCQLFG